MLLTTLRARPPAARDPPTDSRCANLPNGVAPHGAALRPVCPLAGWFGFRTRVEPPPSGRRADTLAPHVAIPR
eukprot:3513094-Prymnesium_polylepis.1